MQNYSNNKVLRSKYKAETGIDIQSYFNLLTDETTIKFKECAEIVKYIFWLESKVCNNE